MTTLREAASLALERLERTIAYSNEEMAKINDAKHALRQALAQEQKPVAWMYTSHYKGNEWFITRYQSELTTYKADKVQPLYTAPPSIEAAVLAEREACAKLCEEEVPSIDGELCADAIRARSEK